MFKKVIAGVISAVMCTSVVLAESSDFVSNRAVKPEPEPNLQAQDCGLTGSNSFAQYLAKQPAENNKIIQPTIANAAESLFSVTNLEFDSETGKIRVVSTQTESSKLTVTFTDQDHPANVYSLSFTAEAGESVLTEGTADLTRLPEFYTVNAQLVNRIGLPVSAPFTLSTYTREVQSILEKDTSDFEPEQVVNFDHDTATNFAVLSENTVKAETTADSNTLVSADYDGNVYVLDHIDETVRALEKGQFFYIQPTENDIIAICVKDITIEGETATLTGDSSEDIGEMFDFIKVETKVTADRPITTTDPDFAEAVTDRKYLSQNSVQALSDNVEVEYPARDGNVEAPENEFTIFERGDVKVTTEIHVPECKYEYNFYKELTYANVHFAIDMTVTVPTELSVSHEAGAGDEYALDPDKLNPYRPTVLQSDEPDFDTHLFHASIPTNIPGLFIFFNVDLGFEASGKFSVEFVKHFKLGFDFDSVTGLHKISESDPMEFKNPHFEGEVKVSLKFSVGATFLGLVDLSVGAEIGLSATVETFVQNKVKDLDGTLQSGLQIFMPEEMPEEDQMHSCDAGMDIKLDLSFTVSGEFSIGFEIPDDNAISIFGEENHLLNGFEWSIEVPFFTLTFHIADYHLMVNKKSSGDGYTADCVPAPCPNQAYRTTIITSLVNIPPEYKDKVTLVVDADEYPITSSAQTFDFFALNGSHQYAIRMHTDLDHPYSDNDHNRNYTTGYINVNDAAQTVQIRVAYEVDDNGNYNPLPCDSSSESGPELPAVTTAPVDVAEFPAETAAPPQEYMLNRVTVRLGDNITGILSGLKGSPSLLTVIGYGDMYDDYLGIKPAEEYKKEKTRLSTGDLKYVRKIIIEDQDPANGLVINNIGNGVFAGAENAEVVYMPGHIQTIGVGAFSGCTNLQYMRYGGANDNSSEFKLPDTLKTIGREAFKGCSSAAFGKLQIPASVTEIGSNAFDGCECITELTIPGDSGVVVKQEAFRGCINLVKADICSGVAPLGKCIFSGCRSMKELTIPSFDIGYDFGDSSRTILRLCGLFNVNGGDALYYDYVYKQVIDISVQHLWYVPKALKTVTVCSGTSVPAGYFGNWISLENVYCPGDVAEIGESAFQNCTSLKKLQFGEYGSPEYIMLPNTLKIINQTAFDSCTGAPFKTLIIPESVMEIKNSAFKNCEGITALVMPGSGKTAIDMHAFNGCKNLERAVFWDGVNGFSKSMLYNCDSIKELVMFSYETYTSSISNLFSETRGGNDYTTKTPDTVAFGYGGDVSGYRFSSLKDTTKLIMPVKLSQFNSWTLSGDPLLTEFSFIGEPGDWKDVEIGEISNGALLEVLGEDRTGGNYTVLTVLENPEDANVYAGTPVTFYTMAAGKYQLSYQWEYSDDAGTTWQDADCTEYKLSVIADASMNGRLYRCIVTDEKGNTVTSGNAKLTVGTPEQDKPKAQKPGDVDCSGSIDVGDAVLLARFITEDYEAVITEAGRLNADVDGNGSRDSNDVVLILKYIARLIDIFPVSTQ